MDIDAEGDKSEEDDDEETELVRNLCMIKIIKDLKTANLKRSTENHN